MDQGSLVEKEINDGQKLIERLGHDNFDVTAACWVKTGEEGKWFLYIVSQVVDEKGLAAAYRVVNDALQTMPESWVSPFEVKLIGATNPIAKDVLALQTRVAGRKPTRWVPRLGPMPVDAVYIYPALALPAVSAEAKVEPITVVTDIRQQGDTLVVKRKVISLPPGTVIEDLQAETIPVPPGVAGVVDE